ncbi:catalase family protein [Methyloversatilis sp. RAC08]|uniref:catalase n=1 Tax=Methyloversatilis sp. RAC08 TaxID=1842540 RepID=UPI00083DD488|nr:catalase [Methyloversatilis sp. RAC08]AOF80928.1 catalase family protein [Methyloversatilis sp. RAC08]
MKQKRLPFSVAGLFLACFAATPLLAAEPAPVDMVDALNGVFGKHAGARGSHAKGFCARGTFTPAPAAEGFANTRLLSAMQVPAEVRFSIGGGNPRISDKSRSARGIAVRLSGPDEGWDMVFISEPVFFAATPASFVSFLKARVADPATKKPDPARIKAHNEQYPEGTRQPSLLAAHAAPASYASTPYFSNHAFRFVAADGRSTWARLQFEPVSGTRHLSEAEEKSLPDDFLEMEFRSRLGSGSVDLDLYAQPAGSGDSLTDSTVTWSNGPAKVRLGRLSIDRYSGQDCNDNVYVPTRLPTGIEPSNDPILRVRAAAYGVSSTRRAQP